MALSGYGATGTDILSRAFSGWPDKGPRPFFYSCWMNWGAYNGNTGVLQIANSASPTVQPRIGLRNQGGASSWLFADSGNSAGNSFAVTYTATTGSWIHHLAFMNNEFGREVYLDGVLKGSNYTGTPSTQTINTLHVGYGIGGALPAASSIAEVLIATGIPTSSQIASLAAGANPLAVLPSSQIICYFPLRSDAVDLSPNSPSNLVSSGSLSAAAIAPGSAKWVTHPTINAAPSGAGPVIRQPLVCIIS